MAGVRGRRGGRRVQCWIGAMEVLAGREPLARYCRTSIHIQLGAAFSVTRWSISSLICCKSSTISRDPSPWTLYTTYRYSDLVLFETIRIKVELWYIDLYNKPLEQSTSLGGANAQASTFPLASASYPFASPPWT